jgi:hypothetical protein
MEMDPIYEAGLKRRWIQTDGLPLPVEIKAVRDEIDRVTHVEVLGGTSRVILYGPSPDGKAIGPVIGALDLMPTEKLRIDRKLQEAEEAAMRAETRGQPGSGEPGDTVIRPFDAKDPAHQAALKGPVITDDDSEAFEPALRRPRLIGGTDTLNEEARKELDALEALVGPREQQILDELRAGTISVNQARDRIDLLPPITWGSPAEPKENWPQGKILALALLGAILAVAALIAAGGGFGHLPPIVLGG